ncbi:putative oxalocrotonate tautomerase [Exophiala viscosa]|uniref:Oxalocrotonate tautomerase n=1 Tax=Exophiala viscosa TaxID=2486360 RepID=A0AAN6IJ82_9EURO|nr:putative oxalocrotonate tautomerase [Exophiala viscosa]
MPLWRIFSHPQTFSLDQRKGLAKAVTELYMSLGLPAFYVNVIFIDVDENGTFIGGEQRSNFVRVVVEQIARTMPSPDTEDGRQHRTKWMDVINEVLKPFIIDRKELDWEMHIYETPRDLWRVQGLDPPPVASDAEKFWAEQNKPTPYV